MNNRWLVTGGTGFIGRELIGRLVGEGVLVRAAVRERTASFPDVVEQAVIGGLGPTTNWHAVVRDVAVVIHLAARVHQVRERARDPLAEYLRVNTDVTVALARAAARTGVRRFVFLSSIKANADLTSACEAAREEAEPRADQRERDPYGYSKWQAEMGLAQVSQETGMNVVSIRSPLVYGRGVKANLASLARAIRLGIPLPLGAVRNIRSLVGMRNLLEFMLLCARHPAAANQTFNVSDGEDVSTPELVRRIAAAMNRPARLVSVPPSLMAIGAKLLGRGDISLRILGSLAVDTTKARTMLGWSPPYTMDEELRRAFGSERMGQAWRCW